MFIIPKTEHKVGSFEDRFETGIYIGFLVRTREHVVGTKNGALIVYHLLGRDPDNRWSAIRLQEIGGTPEKPVPGTGGRRTPAFAKKFEDEVDKPHYITRNQHTNKKRGPHT